LKVTQIVKNFLLESNAIVTFLSNWLLLKFVTE